MAKRERKIAELPEFPRIEVHNARQGFAARAQVLAVIAELGQDDADVGLFGYTLGRRIGEILSLHWAHLDRAARAFRVPSANTKKGEPDAIPLVGAVWR